MIIGFRDSICPRFWRCSLFGCPNKKLGGQPICSLREDQGLCFRASLTPLILEHPVDFSCFPS